MAEVPNYVTVNSFCQTKDLEVNPFIRELKKLNFHPRKIGGKLYMTPSDLESAFIAIADSKEQTRLDLAKKAKTRAQARNEIYLLGLAVALLNQQNQALADAQKLVDQNQALADAQKLVDQSPSTPLDSPDTSEVDSQLTQSSIDPVDDIPLADRFKSRRKTTASKD
jgi:hypothetical protein